MKHIKLISTLISIVIVLTTFTLWLGKTNWKANAAEKKIMKLEEDIKTVDKSLTENEKIDVRQSVILERTSKVIERLEKKL